MHVPRHSENWTQAIQVHTGMCVIVDDEYMIHINLQKIYLVVKIPAKHTIVLRVSRPFRPPPPLHSQFLHLFPYTSSTSHNSSTSTSSPSSNTHTAVSPSRLTTRCPVWCMCGALVCILDIHHPMLFTSISSSYYLHQLYTDCSPHHATPHEQQERQHLPDVAS